VPVWLGSASQRRPISSRYTSRVIRPLCWHAVSVAQETTPDVVLMDLSMPVMNGIDATREVTASVPTVRVIVLTTSTKGQDVHDAAAAGAVGFLSKGADPDDVLDAIRAAAHGGTAWDRRSAEILRRAC